MRRAGPRGVAHIGRIGLSRSYRHVRPLDAFYDRWRLGKQRPTEPVASLARQELALTVDETLHMSKRRELAFLRVRRGEGTTKVAFRISEKTPDFLEAGAPSPRRVEVQWEDEAAFHGRNY